VFDGTCSPLLYVKKHFGMTNTKLSVQHAMDDQSFKPLTFVYLDAQCGMIKKNIIHLSVKSKRSRTVDIEVWPIRMRRYSAVSFATNSML
jgi:hypothetical protein